MVRDSDTLGMDADRAALAAGIVTVDGSAGTVTLEKL
jgi:hypothetical protein